MQWLITWGVKKWLVGVVNTALVEYKDKVEKARAFLATAIKKVDAITDFLKSLDAKLADNKVTDEEVDLAITDAKILGRALVTEKL